MITEGTRPPGRLGVRARQRRFSASPVVQLHFGLPIWFDGLFFNPKGIVSFSPALVRFREGLRWVDRRKVTPLKGLHINDLWKKYNPFRVYDSSLLHPG
jgi:hypothetical protein